jgi:hypothetical protein
MEKGKIAMKGVGDVRTIAAVNNSIASEQGIMTDVPSVPMSVSELDADQLTPQELLLREVEDTIISFEPNHFILGTIAARAAVKRFSGSMEVEHFSVGSDKVAAATISAYTPLTPVSSSTLPLNATDAKIFQVDLLVQARGVRGYLSDGSTVDAKHDLLLQVVAFNDTSQQPVFYAINGYKASPQDAETLIPAIPARTMLYTLSSAASESQLFTALSSHMPRPATAYMQRKVLNIQVSKYFSASRKKVTWGREDVLEAAIREFRRRSEINYLEGVQSRRMAFNSSRVYSGQELIYTSEGLIPQLSKTFGYPPDNFSYQHFLRLSQLLFADDNGSKRALLCAGKDLATSILCPDYQLQKDLTIGTSTHWGINMTDFSSIFGTISMVHYPILDQIGRSAQGFAIDPSRLVRYIYRQPFHESIDMSIHGEEAERDVYVEIDCLLLKGENHVLITPELTAEVEKEEVAEGAGIKEAVE